MDESKLSDLKCIVTCLIAPTPDMLVIGTRSPILTQLDKEMDTKGVVASSVPLKIANQSVLLVPEYVNAHEDKMMKYIDQWKAGVSHLSSALGNQPFNYYVDNYKFKSRIGDVVVCYVLWYIPGQDQSDGNTVSSLQNGREENWLNIPDDEVMMTVKETINSVNVFKDQNYNVATINQLYSILNPTEFDIMMDAMSRYGLRGSKNVDWYQTTIAQWVQYANDARYGLDYSNEKARIKDDEKKKNEVSSVDSLGKRERTTTSANLLHSIDETHEIDKLKWTKEDKDVTADGMLVKMKRLALADAQTQSSKGSKSGQNMLQPFTNSELVNRYKGGDDDNVKPDSNATRLNDGDTSNKPYTLAGKKKNGKKSNKQRKNNNKGTDVYGEEK